MLLDSQPTLLLNIKVVFCYVHREASRRDRFYLVHKEYIVVAAVSRSILLLLWWLHDCCVVRRVRVCVCTCLCVCVCEKCIATLHKDWRNRKLYILALLFRKLLMLLLPYLGESYCVDKAFQDPVYVCWFGVIWCSVCDFQVDLTDWPSIQLFICVINFGLISLWSDYVSKCSSRVFRKWLLISMEWTHTDTIMCACVCVCARMCFQWWDVSIISTHDTLF